MDRGAWWAAVSGVAKSWTQLSTHIQNRLTDVENRLGIAKEKGKEEGWTGSLGLVDTSYYI